MLIIPHSLHSGRCFSEDLVSRTVQLDVWIDVNMRKYPPAMEQTQTIVKLNIALICKQWRDNNGSVGRWSVIDLILRQWSFPLYFLSDWCPALSGAWLPLANHLKTWPGLALWPDLGLQNSVTIVMLNTLYLVPRRLPRIQTVKGEGKPLMLGDTVLPLFLGSAPDPPPSWKCLEHLLREALKIK